MQEPTRQTPLNTVTTSATPFTPNGMSRASSAWRSAFMTCLLVGLSACSCGDPELTPDGGFSDVEGGVESLEGTCGEKGTVCCPPAPGGCGLNLLCKGAPKGTEDTCCVAVASKCDSTTDCCPGYTCDDGKFEECLSPIGGACTGSADCIADAYCPNGQCKPAPEGEGGEGEDCIEVEGGDLQCQKGFVCEEDASGESGKCVACGGLDGDQGQPCCDGSKGCADLFFCNPDNKCQEPKEDGEGDACSEDEPCFNDSLKCVDGTCQRTPQPGDPNSECPGEFSPCCEGNKCGSGLVCDPITDRCMDPALITGVLGGILINGCGKIFCCPWIFDKPGDERGEKDNPLFTCEGRKSCHLGLCTGECKDLGDHCKAGDRCCSRIDPNPYGSWKRRGYRDARKPAEDDQDRLVRLRNPPSCRVWDIGTGQRSCCVEAGQYCEHRVDCCGGMKCNFNANTCVGKAKNDDCYGPGECKDGLECDEGTKKCADEANICKRPAGADCDPSALLQTPKNGDGCCRRPFICRAGGTSGMGAPDWECCNYAGAKCETPGPSTQCCSGTCGQDKKCSKGGPFSACDFGQDEQCDSTLGCVGGQCLDPGMGTKKVGEDCGNKNECRSFALDCAPATQGADTQCCLGVADALCRTDKDCCGGMTCGSNKRCKQVDKVGGTCVRAVGDCLLPLVCKEFKCAVSTVGV